MNAQYSNLTTVKCRSVKEQNIISVPLNIDKDRSDKIMSISGNVFLIDYKVNDGELVYSGRVTHNVLFFDGEFDRLESGMEFTFKVSGEFCSDDSAKIALTVGDFSVRINGGSVFVESVVTADIEISGAVEIKYLNEIDALNKSCSVEYLRRCCVTNSFDVDDEFDTVRVYKVLSSTATVKLKGVERSGSLAILNGDVNFSVLLLPFNQKNDIVKETRVIPFRFEVEAPENALERCNPSVVAQKLNIKVYVDDERDRSVIEASIKLCATVDFYQIQELNFIDDVYSPVVELTPKKECVSFKCLDDVSSFTKRISGKLTATIPENSRFVGACSQRLEVISFDCEASTIDAMLYVDAIMVDGEQNTVSVPCNCPISLSIDKVDKIGDVRVNLVDCSFKFRSGNVEFDVEIEIDYCVYSERSFELICDVIEGEQKKPCQSVISVYVASQGETEWDVTKALGVSIDDIYELNPNLQFPLERSEKIICFRQIR